MKMKISYIPLFFLLHTVVFGQQNMNVVVCNCKAIVDSIIIKNENISFSKNEVHLNKKKSYIVFVSSDNSSDSISKYENVFLDNDSILSIYHDQFKVSAVSLVYDFKSDIFIGESKIYCDNIHATKSEDISDKIELYKKVKAGELINGKQALSIAKKFGIKNPNSFDLSYDPRWQGYNKYDENEKTWKPVWTIKEHSDLNKNKTEEINVIKIDSRTGQILYKYKELKID